MTTARIVNRTMPPAVWGKASTMSCSGGFRMTSLTMITA